MRKPEAYVPTDWDKHLRSSRQCAHGKRRRIGSDKRTYYHRLRPRIQKDTIREFRELLKVDGEDMRKIKKISQLWKETEMKRWS